MKQVLLGNRVVVTEVPAPGIEPGCVLVENAFSFISSGTEAAPVKRAQAGLTAKAIERGRQLPRVLDSLRVNGVRKTLFRVSSHLGTFTGRLGYSSAGRVVAVGSQVTDLAPGDLVACAGMGFAVHAEIVSVPRNLVAKVPEGCDLRSASGATIAAIAMQGVRRARLQLGETAIVIGLGLIGRICLQLLRASGIEVVGFDLNPVRVEAARKDGFEQCYSLSGSEAVRCALAVCNQGADATLITAATNDESICQSAIEMTRKKGRVVVVGAVPLQFQRDPLYRKEIDFLISCSYGPGRYDSAYELNGQDYPYAYVRWTENRNLQSVLKLMTGGQLDMTVLIDREFPVDQAETAFTALTGPAGERPLGIVLAYPMREAEKSLLPSRATRLKPLSPLSTDKVSMGVIGAGKFFMNTQLPNLAELKGTYQLAGVCNRTGAVAQDIARRSGSAIASTDPQELLDCREIQAIMICTRHDNHAELGVAALRAGKHVFVEKPLALNHEQLEQLLEAKNATDRYLQVGFNRRFSSHLQRIEHTIRQRHTPLCVVYRVIADPAPADSWVYGSAGGGRVIGEACHMFDLFGFLVGDDKPLVEVDVVSTPPSAQIPAGDNFTAALKYDDGSICTLVYSTLGRKSPENGKERIELMWDGESYVIDDFQQSFGTLAGLKVLKKNDKGHRQQLVAFADHLLGRRSEPVSWAALVRATELSFQVDAACRAEGFAGGSLT